MLNGGGANPGFSAVVVKSGTITGFFKGISFGTLGGSVLGMKLENNQGSGIITNGSGVISGNVAFGNLNGILAGGDLGAKRTITNNVANGNSTYGIALVGGKGDVVSGNRALSNGDTGIYSTAVGATFTGNIANANGTGMNCLRRRIPPSRSRPRGNKAYWNDHLGIQIGPGDTDLGKNLASGNGAAHQCENVVCSP